MTENQEQKVEDQRKKNYDSQAPGDFDWDADDKGFGTYSAEERSKLEQMYEGTLNTINPSELVRGTVAAITDKDVVLNIGFKSDGLVPLSEFRDMPEIKIGDVLEVLIVDQEDKNGQLVLSRKSAKLMNAWERINSAFDNSEVIEGKVKTRTKGGLVVEIGGIETFLPGSQIDVRPVKDYDQYVGKTMEFKVVKINHQLKNAVVSHKILIESDLEAQKLDIISKLEKGQILEGVIKNMTDFGVFIDLGGVDGLLHITDISWGRINHPSEVLSLDDKVQVVVLDFDDERKRISLGMKQLTAHPWDAIAENLEVGSVIAGKIVTIADYGSFVEIQPGVEGLIHVSEMSWSQHLRNPSDFHKIGDDTSAVVLSIDKDERKMSLGIKQLTPDPWTNITDKYPVGSKHKGIVRNLTNFGLFVELGEGVDGLVHVSDLSWTKKINHPSEFIKKDEEMDVIVLDIDVQNRRLSLGHKQLEENPWDIFETIFMEGSVHQGTVLSFDEKGAVIALPYGLEGSVSKKNMAKKDGGTLKADEQADFKVLEFNKEGRRIVVSHSKIWQEDAAPVKAEKGEKAPKKAKEAAFNLPQGEKSTLGEMDVLSSIKERMMESEKQAQQEAIKIMDDKAKAKDAE